MERCVPQKDSAIICRLKLDLPCCAGMAKYARKEVSSLLEHFRIQEETIKKAQLVVSEAFANVIRHAYDEQGNLCQIQMEISVGQLVITVTDTGKGFQAQSHHEPPSPNQLSGRGLYLIQEMADVSKIDSELGRGTKVIAVINLPDPKMQ